MSKLRLVSLLVLLLVTLSLAVFAKPPQPPVDCSQYNTGLCTYHWDANSFCCKAQSGCVWHCL